MINNLREDILEFLRLAFYHHDFDKNIITDEIMKLIERHKYIPKKEFEKRIDTKLYLLDESLVRNSDYHYGVYHTLKEIKEILK